MKHLLQKLIPTKLFTRYLVIGLSVISLNACSYSPKTLTDSYNNLGKEYATELKQMGDYTAKQTADLDTFADDLMKWHKKTHLPSYATLIKALAVSIESPQGASDKSLHGFIDLLKTFPHFHESHEANLSIAKLATSLSEKQFIQVSKNINEGTRDFTEYFQSSWEKRKRDGVKSLSALLGYLTIDLSNSQLDIIRKHIDYSRDVKNIYIASNETWNNTLIDLLSKRQEPNFVQKFTTHMQNDNLFKRALQLAPDEIKHNDKITINMYKELLASLTDQQKTTLVAQLKSISKTMTELEK